MLSIDIDFSIPGYSPKEIGYYTLVRNKRADLDVQLTNDSSRAISNLNVKVLMESNIGQTKPILFKHSDPEIVDSIPSKGMVPLTFYLYPSFPGLVAISVHVTDQHNIPVKVRKADAKSYQETPVRWWFHVADDISVETLRALKKLLKLVSEGKTR